MSTWSAEEEEKVLRHYALDRLDADEWTEFGADATQSGILKEIPAGPPAPDATSIAAEQVENILALNFQDAFSDPLGLNDDFYRFAAASFDGSVERRAECHRSRRCKSLMHPSKRTHSCGGSMPQPTWRICRGRCRA